MSQSTNPLHSMPRNVQPPRTARRERLRNSRSLVSRRFLGKQHVAVDQFINVAAAEKLPALTGARLALSIDSWIFATPPGPIGSKPPSERSVNNSSWRSRRRQSRSLTCRGGKCGDNGVARRPVFRGAFSPLWPICSGNKI